MRVDLGNIFGKELDTCEARKLTCSCDTFDLTSFYQVLSIAHKDFLILLKHTQLMSQEGYPKLQT